jgi:transcriptional regulator
MYQPPHFREERLEVQHALMRAHPLATLVTHGSSGLAADHIPFLIEPFLSANGTLHAHVARANPLWREADGKDVLVVFQASEAYVTPSWYATKRETGKVVPTWNYAVVHAHGRLQAIEDEAWLRDQIDRLTRLQEAQRREPWQVEDAPAPFVAGQLKGIVGITIEIARLEGKWKVSQNRPEPDRRGVVEGLRAEDDPSAPAMAELVETFGIRR